MAKKKKRLSRREEIAAEKASRKKRWDEAQKLKARKGQKGMTYEQRQADDERIMRERLLKKNFSGDKLKKHRKRLNRDIDSRHGTNRENLKAIKAKNRPGQVGAIVKHQAGNVVNQVKGFFKKKNK